MVVVDQAVQLKEPPVYILATCLSGSLQWPVQDGTGEEMFSE